MASTIDEPGVTGRGSWILALSSRDVCCLLCAASLHYLFYETNIRPHTTWAHAETSPRLPSQPASHADAAGVAFGGDTSCEGFVRRGEAAVPFNGGRRWVQINLQEHAPAGHLSHRPIRVIGNNLVGCWKNGYVTANPHY